MSERREFDVDIDVFSRVDRSKYGVRAMVYSPDAEKILPHPSGVYLETVQMDPLTNLCAFDYKYGSDKGFLKVDVLNNSVYDTFESKEEVYEALEADVDWKLFEEMSVVEKLPHIGKHFELVERVKPQSIDELADVLALIRPAKIKYVDLYMTNRALAKKNLYAQPRGEANWFKKSHAIGYAYMIICALYKVKGTKNSIKW